MPHVPYFTIVVATFNRSRHIVPTIEAALEQTFTDFELLVASMEFGQSGEAEQRRHRGGARPVHCLSRP